MTTFPGSPRLLKGGIVLIDPDSSAVRRIIALQYNPDTLSRTLQVQGAGGEGGDRLEALRLTGPESCAQGQECVKGECQGSEPICTPSCTGNCECQFAGETTGTVCVDCLTDICVDTPSCDDCPADKPVCWRTSSSLFCGRSC